jgi:protein-serine/threonine kinase
VLIIGGELFEHILANKYLKERDAAKLFAQLISGVDYLHRKQIVHRDLKLENLLLDKHRNIIITDFGFANRFANEENDLMATSCGSPCYAAPELVISEGLYIGSAVDVWSCGVILYAMLSGFLPYDDDPNNPEGDNINLLYQYIVNTKLKFPDHLSREAKHLLQCMLVPNPEYRATLAEVMNHPWLIDHLDIFRRSVEDNEWIFQDNMYRKSQEAKRALAMRRKTQEDARNAAVIQRSQSTRPGGPGVTASMLDHTRRSKEQRHHSALPGATTMPEYLNNGGRSGRVGSLPLPLIQTVPAASQPILPALTNLPVPLIAETGLSAAASDTRPESANPKRARLVPYIRPPSIVYSSDSGLDTPAQKVRDRIQENTAMVSDDSSARQSTPVALGFEAATTTTPSDPKQSMSANTNRHTIQVEYDGEASYEQMSAAEVKGKDVEGLRVPMQVPQSSQSDIEMDSSSSDNEGPEMVDSSVDSHQPYEDALTGSVESVSALRTDEDTPKTAVHPTMPSTPPRQTQAPEVMASPSTPRASTVALVDPPVTPRASKSSPIIDAGPTPKASANQSQPVRSTAPALPQPDLRPAGLKPSGLPAPPPVARNRSRTGMSLDKFGLARILGGSGSTAPSSTLVQDGKRMSMKPAMVSAESDAAKDKKSRRKTLGIMSNR